MINKSIKLISDLIEYESSITNLAMITGTFEYDYKIFELVNWHKSEIIVRAGLYEGPKQVFDSLNHYAILGYPMDLAISLTKLYLQTKLSKNEYNLPC